MYTFDLSREKIEKERSPTSKSFSSLSNPAKAFASKKGRRKERALDPPAHSPTTNRQSQKRRKESEEEELHILAVNLKLPLSSSLFSPIPFRGAYSCRLNRPPFSLFFSSFFCGGEEEVVGGDLRCQELKPGP